MQNSTVREAALYSLGRSITDIFYFFILNAGAKLKSVFSYMIEQI